MPSSAPRQPATALVPVLLLMAAMVSMQGGAALAKHLFAAAGLQGRAALRLAWSALRLLPYSRPWRVRMAPSAWPLVVAYGLSLGGMSLMFYMSLRTIPLGIAVALEFVGPMAV